MSVSFPVGGNVSYKRPSPKTSRCLGWDARSTDGRTLTRILHPCYRKWQSARRFNFIFYNNLTSSVPTHTGDNRTGEGDV